jgi:hypothetical protein
MTRPSSTTRVIEAIGQALARRSHGVATSPEPRRSATPRFARASTSPPIGGSARAKTVDGTR